MSYLLISYPDLDERDFASIQSFRKDHDALYYSIVKPHFTFVFPVFDIPEETFIKEIKEKAKNTSCIPFVIRCATINKDAFSEMYHAFLVPDEGNSSLIRLHDKLYSGILKENHRLDIDFIPHIGIGNSNDPNVCKRMVASWNESDFEIKGTISTLTIVHYENNKVTDLDEMQLPYEKSYINSPR